jgi:hypothetical protein
MLLHRWMYVAGAALARNADSDDCDAGNTFGDAAGTDLRPRHLGSWRVLLASYHFHDSRQLMCTRCNEAFSVHY